VSEAGPKIEPIPENAVMAVRQTLKDALAARAPVDATLLARYNATVENPMVLPEGYNPEGGQHVWTEPAKILTEHQKMVQENMDAMAAMRKLKEEEEVK
jgi:hypothetical protein